MKASRLALIAALLSPLPLAAQSDAMARALEQERRGNQAGAAAAYAEALRQDPGNLSALLGMERTLTPLGREAELAAPAEALLARDPSNAVAYSVAMRGWAAAQRLDSLASLAARWARVEPGSETPYREWGSILLGRRDASGARKAYFAGRRALGDSTALAGEIALIAAATGSWDEAAREWARSIERYPGYRTSARTALSRAPSGEQAEVLRELLRGTPTARRLAAELQVQWGEPAAAVSVLLAALPANREEAATALRQFLEAARAVDGTEAAQARGVALEQLAVRLDGTTASRARLEAARAYADGGDPAAARRMLAQLATDPAAPPDMAASASATLVTVLLREGKVPDAEQQLAQLRPTLGEDAASRLTLLVVDGYLHAGQLDRAEGALAADSSVDAMARRGLIRLYRGDLAGAGKALAEAGPFTGSREEATARTALLALIQPIQTDTLPALGAALLTLARGDSLGAVAALVQVAGGLPAQGGGASLRLLAGRIEAAAGRQEAAEQLLRAAADSSAPATAPAAELELARLLLSLGRTQEAEGQLEHLILAWPGSAAVPEARRLLDAARGGVPET